jgi:hypothetical protein
MEEHEYLERFRLATLWDEFRRRPFPVAEKELCEADSNRATHVTKKVRKRKRSRSKHNRQDLIYKTIGQPRRSLPKFDWEDFLYYSSSVEIYISSFFFLGGIRDIHFSIPSFQMYIWGLRTHIEDIRNPEIKDYYQQLLYIADEVLKELKSINGLK